MKELYQPKEEYLGPVLELTVRNHSQQQIADSLGITKKKVQVIQQRFRKDYLAFLASKALIPKYYNENLPEKDINKEFFDKLSRPDSALTTEEVLYCAFYVSTGNSIDALIRRGLDCGIEKGHEDVYTSNCLLRSEMLKRKANIQEEIRRVQQEKHEYREINKDRILEMHLEMIEQLREEGNPKNKSYIIKLLDQVNKMEGNYALKIERTDISADDVLDGMLARAQVAKPPELHELYEENEEIEDEDDESKEAY